MALRQDELQALERALRARARYLRGEVTDKLGEAASDAGGMNTGGDFGDQSFASSESSLDLAEAQRDINELRGSSRFFRHYIGDGAGTFGQAQAEVREQLRGGRSGS